MYCKVLLPYTILLAWWLITNKTRLYLPSFFSSHTTLVNRKEKKILSSRVAATVHSWSQHLFF